jgi:hypothetical protein
VRPEIHDNSPDLRQQWRNAIALAVSIVGLQGWQYDVYCDYSEAILSAVMIATKGHHH